VWHPLAPPHQVLLSLTSASYAKPQSATRTCQLRAVTNATVAKWKKVSGRKWKGQKLEHSWGLFWRLCFQNAESGLPLPKSLPQSTGRSGVSHRTYFLRKGKQMPFSLSGLVPQSSGLSSNFVVTPCDVFAALVRNCSAKLPPFGISAKRWKRWAASRLPGQEN
jgi:hypothetical protein